MMRRRILLSLASALAACGLLAASPQEQSGARFRPETLRVSPDVAERAASLAAALGFETWRRPTELYRAPAVSRALLAEPAAVAQEVHSCTKVRFGDEGWDRCVWSWKVRGEGRETPDELDLEITVTPSSRAAQEYLLTTLVKTELPAEAVVSLYRSARRPEGLGDFAVLVDPQNGPEARLDFLRANLVIRLRGERALRGRLEALARRLDERLLAQQPVTLEELRAEQRAKPRGPS